MHATRPLLSESDFPPLQRGELETLQVNLGYLCNQSCIHCHVNAGPRRTEVMSQDTINDIVSFLEHSATVNLLDLTGGAPELNPHFRDLVATARDMGIAVMDRCNLTVLEEPGQDDLERFLARHRVAITASLPCYLEDNVDAQRGGGVFAKSIRALQRLNRAGYGRRDSDLQLNLVYNPQGAVLPPQQTTLESAYRDHLHDHYGIVFNRLFTLANMPIQRFGSLLVSRGLFHGYMKLLRDNFNEAAYSNVMCRTLLSIDWQGYVYDCDFNQMLGLPLQYAGRPRPHIRDLSDRDLHGNPIAVMDHCYGCTAGQGSSCGGALAGEK